MTKVYLIKFAFENGRIYAIEVFTNKKLAENYKRYWAAKLKSDEDHQGEYVELETKNINKFDYYQEAIKEEAKQLPF